MQNETIGIYLITERATGRDVYVGQGIVYDRWKAHRKKYPEELFDYRILLECSRTDLNFWEQHYIRVLKTHWTKGGFNQTWGGQFWPCPEEPLSPATRKKQSEAMKAYYASMTEEKKRQKSQKISEVRKAREASITQEEKKERSQKWSEAAKAREASMTEEEKQKRSKALKASYTSKPEEEKRERAQKISETHKTWRASMTEEDKQKLSEARKALLASMTEEEKQKRSQKITEANRVRHASMTPEEKREWLQKLSEARKATAARKRAAKAAAIAGLEALLAS